MKPEPLKPARQLKLLWPVAALALLLSFNLIFTRGFFRLEVTEGSYLSGSLIDIVKNGSIVMLLSLGMTLVIATGGVDLSVGAVMAIAGAVAATIVNQPDGNFTVAVIAAVGASLLAGAWNGLLVGVFRIQPIVATLILMVAGRGVAQLITAGQIITFHDQRLTYLCNGHFLGAPFPVWVVAFMLFLTAFWTRKTAWGLFIECVGDNEQAATYAGISSRAVKFVVYMFSGLCAGLAGLLAASNIKGADSDHAGLFLELDAIVAVVVGGTALAGGRFYLMGSIVGALIIQALTTTMYAQGVSSDVAPVPKALVILAVCLLQSPIFRGQIKRLAGFAGLGGAEADMKLRPKYIPLLATILVFVVLYTFGCVHYDRFGSPRVAVNLLDGSGVLGVAAVGETFVILSGGIDLSVGAVVAATSILIASLIGSGAHPLAAMAIALAAGAGFGAAMGALIHFYKQPPFMITLAGMFLARGLGFIVRPQSLGIKHAFYKHTINETLAIPLTDKVHLPFTATAFVIVLAIAIFIAHLTRFGRMVYAIGDDESSATLMGVPIGRTKILIYTLSGFCSALAGVLHTIYMQSGDPSARVGFELDAIAAVVIGGTLLRGGVGFVGGTAIGVLILGLIQTLIYFQGNLNSWWTSIVVGLLVLLFIGLQNLVTAVSSRSRKVSTGSLGAGAKGMPVTGKT